MAQSGMMPNDPLVRTVASRDDLAAAAAEYLIETAAEAVRENGRCTVALSGGATPNGVYALLATKPYRSRVSWPAMHLFWGDERCVPPEDPRSNYRAAFELLLAHVPIPAANVHRMRGEIDPSDGAAEYEAALRTHFATGSGAPRFAPSERFDLVMLGVGTDGHTASLFPDSNALHETVRWVAPAYARVAETWRLTLTLPVINASAKVLFLLSGEDKRPIARRMLHAADDGAPLPAQRVVPVAGEVTWLLDAAAALPPTP
jgi:6-phosphogluconolactonase